MDGKLCNIRSWEGHYYFPPVNPPMQNLQIGRAYCSHWKASTGELTSTAQTHVVRGATITWPSSSATLKTLFYFVDNVEEAKIIKREKMIFTRLSLAGHVIFTPVTVWPRNFHATITCQSLDFHQSHMLATWFSCNCHLFKMTILIPDFLDKYKLIGFFFQLDSDKLFSFIYPIQIFVLLSSFN